MTDDPASLREAISRCTVDQLKEYLSLFAATRLPTRKADLASLLEQQLDSEAALRAVLARLDELQRTALADSVHHHAGHFFALGFDARYRALPAFSIEVRRFHKKPTLLNLLFGAGSRVIPEDLCERLRKLLPPPEPMALQSSDELPEAYNEVPLHVRGCEGEAVTDLTIALRLADAGKLQVSEKTAMPSAASVQLLCASLSNGDYFPDVVPSKTEWINGCLHEAVGPIKGFAWPLLLQTGKLVERHGKRLALTAAGRLALADPAAALRTLWQLWKQADFDEFSRIEHIKGQSRRETGMTRAAPRRVPIADGLAHCPVGAWVAFDDFSRYLRAEGHLFDICRDPWKLYIADSHYGSLGYAGCHGWNILQERYLRCLLFEYAAPLGLIDIAYLRPEAGPRDAGKLWGMDGLAWLSRYDGLAYFRLTALGAYCLGLSARYQPTRPAVSLRLSVMPSGIIRVISGSLGVDERLMLDGWAEADDDQTWRLERSRLLAAIEGGRDPAELLAFLADRDEQPLPERVEALLRDCSRRARALKPVGAALLFACETAELADQIASHSLTAKWCQRSGERHLAVLLSNEARFHAALRDLGYGIVVR